MKAGPYNARIGATWRGDRWSVDGVVAWMEGVETFTGDPYPYLTGRTQRDDRNLPAGTYYRIRGDRDDALLFSMGEELVRCL